ncbi:hypothetical protein ACSBR1_008397 [Camellia fascicularis]
MWCQWVKSYLLKGKSFWKVSIPSDSSWVWRKILSLRKAVFPLILHKIGNGHATFLWHDNWHPVGSIRDNFGDRIIYDSGLHEEAKVSSIVNGDSWNWPFPNSWEIRDLISLTPQTFKPRSSSNDIPVWTLTHDGKFSIHSAWIHWRVKHDKVAWYKLLWGPLTIPRVSFIVWIALHGRLNTGDRLESFGMSDDFKCSFAITTLKATPTFSLIASSLLRESRGKSLKAITTRLSLLCTVCQIWIERNNRIFNKEMKPKEVVIKTIVQMIRGRLMSMYNLPRSTSDDWFLKQWNLTDSILKPCTNSIGRAAKRWEFLT